MNKKNKTKLNKNRTELNKNKFSENDYYQLFNMNEGELKKLLNDKNQPMIIRIIIKNMLSGKGFDVVEKMLKKWSIDKANIEVVIKDRRGRGQKYTPSQLRDKFYEYLAFCKKTTINRWIAGITNKPLTITWFCLFAWVNKDFLSEKSKDPIFSGTVKEIRTTIENDVEEKALLWVYSPTASSFNLKHNFGWQDKNYTELSWNIEVKEILSSIKNKWMIEKK